MKFLNQKKMSEAIFGHLFFLNSLIRKPCMNTSNMKSMEISSVLILKQLLFPEACITAFSTLNNSSILYNNI